MNEPDKIPQRRGRSLLSLLFPEEPRDFPFRRTVRSLLRALHILTGGTLLGGCIFSQSPEAIKPWLLGTMASGFLLLATDLHASLAVLCEVRGALTVGKLLLLAIVPALASVSATVAAIALMIGAVGSHLPRRYRHRVLLFPDRIVPDRRRG